MTTTGTDDKIKYKECGLRLRNKLDRSIRFRLRVRTTYVQTYKNPVPVISDAEAASTWEMKEYLTGSFVRLMIVIVENSSSGHLLSTALITNMHTRTRRSSCSGSGRN